ncbi:MAG: DUF1156 domain-containing protein, partial [Candidatus Contubernalis sp.]|nr:DUF1156 domain-containing protein [Candidatus Contubernalis sp.]
MLKNKDIKDLRLIEAGFPCHQVGAETQRERDTGKAPPVNRLHVWWARRPLTPSRAAILASLLPADTDPDWFLRQLGMEKVQAQVKGEPWTLIDDRFLNRIVKDKLGREIIEVDAVVRRALQREQVVRENARELIKMIVKKKASIGEQNAIHQWIELSNPLPEPLPTEGETLLVKREAADPAWFKSVMELSASVGIRVPNLYGYPRAYNYQPDRQSGDITVLDPTAGGGSIPFEALRLGHQVIANELNPVAAVILYATLDYPVRFGAELGADIDNWGRKLINSLSNKLDSFFPRSFPLPNSERLILKAYLSRNVELF